MLDHQRVVEEIQAALASSSGASDLDLLRDTAVEYSILCSDTNQRLDECNRLLKRGLRWEAKQVAEREPELLDLVALLDFPDREAWLQLLSSAGMVLPPPLRIDLASELNAAYAIEAPLHGLLKRHRLLALSRAPLAARIQTLRAIRERDRDNPIWTEDLKLLESARLQEVEKEAQQLGKTGDAAGLSALAQEVTSDAWISSPKRELVERVVRLSRQATQTDVRTQLAAVEERLSIAYGAFDVPAGREARQAWNAFSAIAPLASGDPIRVRAEPALAWLAEEDRREETQRRFAGAVQALDQSLEDDARRPTLERLITQVQRFDQEPPVALMQRAAERLRSIDAMARRRFVLATIGVVGLLLFAAGLTGWYLVRGQRERELASAVASVREMVDKDRLLEAQQFLSGFDKSHPYLAGRPSLEEQRVRLHNKVEEEQNRQAQFAAAIEQVQVTGVAAPDHVHLGEAERLAKTADERAIVARWEADLAKADAARRKARSEAFLEEFHSTVTAVEAVENQVNGEEAVTDAEFDLLLAQIRGLESKGSGLQQELVSQIEPLKLRVNAIRRQWDDSRRQAIDLSAVSRAVGSLSEYRRALENFRRNYREAALAGEFERVLAESPLWELCDRWRAVYSRDAFKDLSQVDPKLAHSLLEAGNELLTASPDHPFGAPFREKVPYLTHITERYDKDGKSRVSGLRRFFEDRVITSLWCITAKTGERFYLLDEPGKIFEREAVNILYITDFNLTTKGKRFIPADVEKYGKAPQAQLAARCRQGILDLELETGSWERGILSMAEHILADTETDPLLRFILLRRVIEVGRSGSHSIRVGFEPIWKDIEAQSIDLSANWLMPGDELAKRSRVSAAAVLDRVKDLSAVRKQVEDTWREDQRAIPELPGWVAWLRLRGRMPLAGQPNSEPLKDGELLALVPTSQGAIWKRLGLIRSGIVQWEQWDPESFIAGRPVFWRPLPPSEGTPTTASN